MEKYLNPQAEFITVEAEDVIMDSQYKLPDMPIGADDTEG